MNAFERILQEVLNTLFTYVLQPILETFLQFVVNTLIEIISDTFAWVFYYILSTLLSVVKFLNGIFEFFSGSSNGSVMLNDVKYRNILELFFSLDIVSKVFGVFLIVAFVMSVAFTIIKVIKSMSDMTLDNKNPISKVLSTAFKTGITFLIIPLLCLFMLRLSAIVVNQIDIAVNEINSKNVNPNSKKPQDGYVSIDSVIWYNASLKVATDTNGLDIRNKVFYNQFDYRYEAVNSSSDFKKSFPYKNFDYATGIVSAILVIIILLICIIAFIQRLFELLVLYLVGPFFASTMPLDDGEMFKNWKDLFIAKFFSAFGSVYGMRIYLILTPIISGNSITFEAGNETFNSFMRLLILIGGAFAIYKSQNMVLKILNPEAAASAEAATQTGFRIASLGKSLGVGIASSFMGGLLGGNSKKDDNKNGNSNGNSLGKNSNDTSNKDDNSAGSGAKFKG